METLYNLDLFIVCLFCFRYTLPREKGALTFQVISASDPFLASALCYLSLHQEVTFMQISHG